MYGVVNGLYQCQENRVEELNIRISTRNLPSEPLPPYFSSRAVPTRYVKMPIVDCRLQSDVKVHNSCDYSPYTVFNPGDSAPYAGYATAIDQNSRLKNIFFPLQDCPQSKYIPSSTSELYNYRPIPKPVNMTHNLLFKSYKFNSFNPNMCDLGKKLFNNHTRIQTKNFKSLVI